MECILPYLGFASSWTRNNARPRPPREPAANLNEFARPAAFQKKRTERTEEDSMSKGLALFATVLLSASAVLGQAGKLSDTDFTSARECGACHEEIYNQWSQSMHSQSLTDPIYRAVFDEMMKATQGAQRTFCLTCHAPVASVTGKLLESGRDLDWNAFSAIEAEGVTCDFCHTISGNENLGKNISVGAYVYPRRGTTTVKYGRHPDAGSSAHETQVSRFLLSSEQCAICHKFKHPVAGLEIQNTFQEWQQGPYSKQGIRCQDCHMPAYSGVVAKDGKYRDEIHAHAFMGGHTEMVRKAATLTVWGVQGKKGDASKLTVTSNITNSGAGHTIPTGIPGIREMRLEVEVIGPLGEILDQKRFRYGQRLVRRDGSDGLPWEEFRSIEDIRIQPKQSRQSTFEILLPPQVKGNIQIRARLLMALISEALSRRLNIQAPDPVLMTTAQATLALQSDAR